MIYEKEILFNLLFEKSFEHFLFMIVENYLVIHFSLIYVKNFLDISLFIFIYFLSVLVFN